jgi:hypothetical protein
MLLLGYKPSRTIRCNLVTLTLVKVQRWDEERAPDANYRDGNNSSHFNRTNIFSAVQPATSLCAQC